ncbi:MAG TPA: enoyl-CoA hydratase [Alphaproteobacteria bacterium]|nr:enoyl-CoA hydratase [Alphaproteobacteria bacterium]
MPSLEVEAPAPAGRLWPDLGQLACLHDVSHATLWSFMEFEGRPSYNPDLLADFHGWQRHIPALKDEVGEALKYVVLGSRHPGAFCFGGDLDHFMACIGRRDREALIAYGRSCITILHRNWRSCERDLITIGLVQGDALGGGFESLLSFDILVAEKGVKFGFPEQLFGLFPGMGALTFLGRKLGSAKAEWLVRTGRTLTAEELYELGIVHVLAEPGQGIDATRRYITKSAPRFESQLRMHRAMKRAAPVSYEELDDIVVIWADACMQLDAHNLTVMRRLIAAQTRMSAAA